VTLDSPEKVARAMLRAMRNAKANTKIVWADNDGVEAVESK
jgi:hypothetical protein